ncbi:PfkB family carbohydrate kinase [Frankia sp. AgPm24]|uniref:PfkB family carbohydrate kinase n=1 Tax=Frankia sp. AgPm24 TaxID=631128 RepID=UPI00200D5DCE|nr:PfkB family carbohydrate kinase [Frankia sp. AgPm24]MCK9923245.1 PfkB family carbohydrate kinase [Frankia sp. AgPm24]
MSAHPPPPTDRPPPLGLFIGLTTFDTVYQVRRPPHADEKIVAEQFMTAAGGPATGAAVTFAHLGGQAVLLSAIGTGPLAQAVRADLAATGVTTLDLRPHAATLPISAIMVSASTGQRAVVSAHGQPPPAPPDATPPDRTPPDGMPPEAAMARACAEASALLPRASVVLLDGHQPAAALEILTALAAVRPRSGIERRPLVILDAGSWKPGTDRLLPHLDIVISGAAFRPPTRTDSGDAVTRTLRYLLAHGPSFAAVTAGPGPIRWADATGHGTVTPPAVHAVDTLGAGDVLHGAFAWAVAQGTGARRADLVAALTSASGVASRSVGSFGSRAWLGPAPTSD